MCGISGILDFKNKEINTKKIIRKIIDYQINRGPDNNDIWQSQCKKITLGHNRLSIIDLTKDANQPFISTDKRYVITFNGEIYIIKKLKMLSLKKILISSQIQIQKLS